jgi:radical SAM protein with 4Fe4S-binding SPASM domain
LSSITFDLGCSVGNATQFAEHFLPHELQRLLSLYIKEKKKLKNEGYGLELYEKSHFLRLTHFENEEFYPTSTTNTATISGCLVGWVCTPILSDGTILGCRRMPLKVGKMPEQSFEEILLGSNLLKKFRRPESFAECGQCDFYQYCLGCPAVAYGLTGDPFAKNPLCFRSLIPRQTSEAKKTTPGLSLNSNFSEEFDLLAKRHSTTFPARFAELFEDEQLQSTFVDLTFSTDKLKRFLADPQNYLEEAGQSLSDPGIVFLIQYFTRLKAPSEDAKSNSAKLASAMVGRMLDRILN